jgi:hypothetical protein
MADIEKQLDLQSDPTTPASPSHLLALVDALQAGTLNDGQRETVQTLRSAILSLAKQAVEDSTIKMVGSDFQAQ